MTKKLIVHVPSTGWVVENIAPQGSGKIEMSSSATVCVTEPHPTNPDQHYEIELSKPANGSIKNAQAIMVTLLEDTDDGECMIGQYDLSAIELKF